MPKRKWRLWMAGTGLAAAVGVAVFVGAAAATTGAPVFYDARYPAPASTGPGGYDVDEGPTAERAPADGSAEEAGTRDDSRPGTPDSGRPGPTTPPSDAPGTPAPGTPAPGTPTPGTPGPNPSDEPAPPTDRNAATEPRAPGGPPTDGTRPTEPPTPEEQEAWLAFQQLVRECMADAGHEYLHWEWWNPPADASNRFPAMPADLTSEQYAAWQLALHGETGTGEAYRWQDAGCWGAAVHATGGTN